MKAFPISQAQLCKLAEHISNMDGRSTLSERNHNAQDAHSIIEDVVGDDAELVYGVDDADPVEQYRLESQLRADGVLCITPKCSRAFIVEERKPQGGFLERVKNELVRLGEQWGWV